MVINEIHILVTERPQQDIPKLQSVSGMTKYYSELYNVLENRYESFNTAVNYVLMKLSFNTEANSMYSWQT